MLVYIILSAAVFCIIPDVGLAWGPGTHIEIALSLLEKIALMAPAVRAVIAGREEWFLYGSVAADIIVGKKYAGEYDHCHNWRVGFNVLRSAKTDRERAAAYGYLAHLASDIIAHNYFIPFKIIKSYRAKVLSHTYWEMRFDMHVRNSVWDEMSKMIMHDFSPFDNLLKRTLKRALFSFGTSKKIFSGILALQRFRQFRRSFAAYSKKSKYGLDIKDVKHYMRLAFDSALGILSDPKTASCIKCDPTGTEKIGYAQWARWRIKRQVKKGELTGAEIDRQLNLIRKRLYEDVSVCLPSSQR
ncbi:MAG: zinc dependent phospholipase C family protein [Deltaproteobacteria bacterium]|nr:zinc dependent phospholipase C family protein [Deltaproteobacteria bacterium]